MDKIVSYEQIQGFVGEIRSLRQGYATNFFWDEQKHPYWVKDGSLQYKKNENCYILIHQNGSFCNLFYITTDVANAVNSIQQLSLECDGVLDMVAKGEGKGEVENLKSIGFETYKYLYRMSHIGQLADDNWKISPEVKFASDADTLIIYNTLQKDFDPVCEQLPSIQEIHDYTSRKQLLVIKDGKKLCGFLIFEVSGKTSWYLRYWYTSPEYRNQRVGSRLLKTALVLGKETKRQQLWVISDNENAIKRYEHYGFQKEPFHDFVMIKKFTPPNV